ncbi:MAM and LDL-receptor class A domain-containing protein 1-like isoform X2 [Mercenaria mercenaria]|uniref:MAM and LDL-receptor class A domain-containing protein 1-like isoform X2 n=1 Tax=Mercenaria mercenaria TaxID=6596 RepID=UPI00234F7FAD|nr:MAM and LDL-receptor class A domain-containing protein 1-like isoform X2 [Mercenaria mercenaria]
MANNLYLRLLWILLSIYKSSAVIEGDSFDCDFEDGFCNWKQDKMDDFDWTRLSGETLTDGTGPDSDHTSGEGFYVYIETPRNDVANNTARLISPQKDSGQYCFSFWYHMYGNHINRLSLSKKEGTDTKELFLKTGDQGKQWILGQIRFVAEDSFQIVIEGKARNYEESWSGDIAVDDIVLFPIEKCQIAIDRDSFNCSFDDGFCNWEQDKTDDFDWKWLSGSTPTQRTGPEFDHTSGEGFYVYIETTPTHNSLSKMDNYEASLVSPQKDPGQYCFSFWYHMYGSHINRLRVSKKEGKNINELFSKMGDQGKQWILGQIQFVAKESFQIVIEGKARNHERTWFGDIAIDDIVMFPTEKCPTDCSDHIPEAGVANPINNEVGSGVQITSCKAGYKISSVICFLNGSWINRPLCQPIDPEGPEGSALVAVYVTVPLVIAVLAIMLTLVVCRKRPLKCSKASGAQQGEHMNPVIQETMETNNVVNEYEHLNSNTMQTGTSGSALPTNEYAVLSDTENDEEVHVYYSTAEAKFIDKSDDKLGYENVKSFALPFGGMSENTIGAKCEPNGDETPIQLYESLKTDTQNKNDCYDLLNKN